MKKIDCFRKFGNGENVFTSSHIHENGESIFNNLKIYENVENIVINSKIFDKGEIFAKSKIYEND